MTQHQPLQRHENYKRARPANGLTFQPLGRHTAQQKRNSQSVEPSAGTVRHFFRDSLGRQADTFIDIYHRVYLMIFLLKRVTPMNKKRVNP